MILATSYLQMQCNLQVKKPYMDQLLPLRSAVIRAETSRSALYLYNLEREPKPTTFNWKSAVSDYIQ